jgi:hypothetical protein
MRETLRRLERLEREIEMLKGRVRQAISHARSVIAEDPCETERAVQARQLERAVQRVARRRSRRPSRRK